MSRRFQRLLCVSLLVSAFSGVSVRAQTSPERYLGFKPGTDRKLADYDQISGYLELLAKESPKVKLVDIGRTTQNRPIKMAIITAASNMPKLDRYREIARNLRDARGITPEMAKELAQEGKVILAVGCNIHSDEIGASQMALELAYRLAKGDVPEGVEQALNDVILLLIPSVNPDGQQMVTEWYRKYLGTEFEGGPMPWLYHPYAGHKINRDFYMFNLPETRAEGAVLFRDWLPQIFISEHQAGIDSARQWISPYNDPFLPDVHPLVWQGIEYLGGSMRYSLGTAKKPGVSFGDAYTGWWTGGEDEVSWTHNIIGMLTEAASARLATPIFINSSQLSEKMTTVGMTNPNPWKGGWWRLSDIVDNELILNFSAIRAAAERKSEILNNFYEMNRAGIENPGGDGAYVISADQHDNLAALRMVDAILFGGVEVKRADAPFVAGGNSYPSGSFIVPLAQPYRAHVITLLDRQKYPDVRSPDGAPIPPYDNAGWTLPFLMGVKTDRVSGPFNVQATPITSVSYSTGGMPGGEAPFAMLDTRANESFAVASSLLKAGATVWRTLAPATVGEERIPAGQFIVKMDAIASRALPPLLSARHVTAKPLPVLTGLELGALRAPRIGLYQSYYNTWMDNIDEGTTRYVLDNLGVTYRTLHNADMTSKALEKFDVIILPSLARDLIVEGKHPGSMNLLPPPYSGGIGQAGIDALKKFVASGGRIVAVNETVRFAIKDLEAPATEVMEGVDPSKYSVPNSLVRIKIDPAQPIGFGMPAEGVAMLTGTSPSDASPILQTVDNGRADYLSQVVASYPSENVLQSGLATGTERMANKAAVIDIKQGRGRVIMIGFSPLFRAQSHGTYKLLLNALFYPESTPRE